MQHLDQRLVLLLENAYYQVDPFLFFRLIFRVLRWVQSLLLVLSFVDSVIDSFLLMRRF